MSIFKKASLAVATAVAALAPASLLVAGAADYGYADAGQVLTSLSSQVSGFMTTTYLQVIGIGFGIVITFFVVRYIFGLFGGGGRRRR